MGRHQTFLAGLSALAISASAHGAGAQDAAAEASLAPVQCGSLAAPWLGGQAGDIAASPLQEAIQDSTAQTRGFRLDGPAAVRIESRTNGSGDPTVRLFDGAGDELGFNDDMERSLNAQLQTDLPAGDYCVTVDDHSGSMDVTLQVGLQEHPALNETTALACGPQTEARPLVDGPLDVALQARGQVAADSDASRNGYLRVTLNEASALSLRATGDGRVDPQIALFDAAGLMIASNDDADGRDARLDFSPSLPAGEYCIGVGPVSDGSGTIKVSAYRLDPMEYLRQAHARGELPPIDDSYAVQPLEFTGKSQVVLQGGAANWFRFDLDIRALITVRTLGSIIGIDTKLALFDADGGLVHEIDDVADSRNAQIAPLLLQPGSYMLALTDVGTLGQSGAPLRPVGLLAEKFVSATRP